MIFCQYQQLGMIVVTYYFVFIKICILFPSVSVNLEYILHFGETSHHVVCKNKLEVVSGEGFPKTDSIQNFSSALS